MQQYLDLCKHVLENGVSKEDRTGTGTLSTFGYQMRFNLEEGFPVLTTKKLFLKGIIHELLWFLKGSTDVRDLIDEGVNFWTPDATRWYNERHEEKVDKESYVKMLYNEKWTESYRDVLADLGPIYSKQWRAWQGDFDKIDQIKKVIESIKENPDSRRHLVSAWNVSDLDDMALPPCHYAFQFYVADGKLSCMFQMRSTDVFLGLPFNIASYALLTMMIAQVTGLKPGELVYTGGDVHIYKNHIDQVQLQLTREPKRLPKMWINPAVTSIDDFKYEDFALLEYVAHPHIKGEVSV